MRSFLEKLKGNYSFIKLVVVHSAYLGATGNLGNADLLLAGTQSLVDRFRFEELKPELFYHYFGEEILTQDLNNKESDYELTFLGTSGYGKGYMHTERCFLLRKLIEESKLELWLHEIEYSGKNLG